MTTKTAPGAPEEPAQALPAAGTAVDPPSAYVPRRPPRARQAEALAVIRGKRVFALRMAQRCVDCETEYLSPAGWRRIDTYDGGSVAEFKLDGTAHFVEPLAYVKTPVSRFWHFKTQGGMDQVLNDEHRMLLCGRRNATWGKYVGDVPRGYRSFEKPGTDAWREITTVDFESSQPPRHRHAPVTFFLKRNSSRIDMTDDEIRLMVAFHADGCLGYSPMKPETPRYGFVRLKRARKKKRLREILTRANIPWREFKTKTCPDYTSFKFVPPRLTKQYDNEWWLAGDAQREVIVDEVFHWDGQHVKIRHAWAYSSRHRSDADFIQYCLASTGRRSSITGGKKRWDRPTHYGANHRVHMTGDGRSNNLVIVPRPKIYSGKHDGFMYSFSVPSTYLVLRRNGKVFITGNCGKSKVLIDDFGRMVVAGAARDLLVVSPGGAYRTWPDHVRLEFPRELLDQTRMFLWESGRAKTKVYLRELDDFLEYKGPRVLVVNVEALSMVQAARNLCVNFLLQSPRRNVVALDESVAFKNPESKCGAFAAEVLAPLAARRRILTGLIAPRSPLDLFNQFRFLDPGILGFSEFTTFKARYAVVKKVCMEPNEKLRGLLRNRLGAGGYLTRSELQVKALSLDPNLNLRGMTPVDVREYLKTAAEGMPRDQMIDAIGRLGGYVQTIPVVEAYQNIEELYAKISPHSYRCRLDDCYDMPASDWAIRDVDWHPEQKRIYDDLKKTATAELASMDHVTATHVVVRMMRLHQVLCGHAVDEDGKIHVVPERRIRALLDLLEDYDGKAVIWCSYQYNVKQVAAALAEEYGEASVAQFWGGNAGAPREAESSRFKSDTACKFMVATPDAGRYGRDWREADLSVYYSSKNNLDHRSQSEERVRAVGKTRPVAYVDLKVPGTVEDKIITALRDKIDLAAVIDGDRWREWVI